MTQYLTEKNLFDACDHALALWTSGDHKVSEEYRRSDMDLLTYFGGHWIEHFNNGTQINFDDDEFIRLIHRCQFGKAITKKMTLVRFEQFAKFLVQPNFKATVEYSLSLQTKSRWEYGSKFCNTLANSLSDFCDANYELASAFLFFAVPQLYFFNYSQPTIDALHDRIGMTGRVAGIVGRTIGDLYLRHAEVLHALPRPAFSSALQRAVTDGDWWERRVLELAVSDHWK